MVYMSVVALMSGRMMSNYQGVLKYLISFAVTSNKFILGMYNAYEG